MIKVILFDLDDTLIKTFSTKKEALKQLAQKYYGVQLNDSLIKKHWGKPMKELLGALIPNIDNFEEAINGYVELRKNFPTTSYEDTIPALKKLSKQYLLGIITSKSNRYLQDDFDISGIPQELFFIIQAEEETTVHKPNPKVFDFALKKLKDKNIKNSEVVYVGDRLSDFYAARAVGFKFYGILNGTTSDKEFKAQGAKTIKDISQLLDL